MKVIFTKISQISMNGEENEYACPSTEEFQEILDGLFTEGSMEQCKEKIMYMISESSQTLNDLFRCCATAIQQPNATKRIIYNALVVLKRPITPSKDTTLDKVREKWFSEPFSESRRLTKESLVMCLTSEFFEVRNEAAHCITYLLIIEQYNWEDLIPFLIKKLDLPTTSGDAKFGIIATFKEIFNTSEIFNPGFEYDQIPSSFADLFMFLVNQLSIEDLDQEIYIECTQCLDNMLTQIPQFFVPDIVNNLQNILSSVEKTFPTAELALFRQYHFLMITIFETFYKFADEFIDRITLFALNGFESDFNAVSIDFWKYFYIVEKKNDYKDEDKFHYFRKESSEKVLDAILNLNLRLKDEENLDYQPPEINDWNYHCSIVMNKIVKASIIGDPDQNDDKIAENIYNYINYCLNEGEKNLSTLLAIIAAISSICVKNCHKQCDDYFCEFFPFIIECCQNECPRVSVNSLDVLNKFIRRKFIIASKPEFLEKIFNVVNFQIDSKNEIIISKLIKIMISCSETFQCNVNSEHYKDFYDIVTKMLSNEMILNSNLNGKAYSILNKYFINFNEHIFSDESSIENGKALLDFSLDNLRGTLDFMTPEIESLQIEVLYLIQTLIKFLQAEAEAYLEKIIKLILTILKKQCFIEDCFTVLTSIAYSNKNKILDFIEPILASIEIGFDTKSPLIIGKSSLLIGAVFFNLGPLGEDYIENSFDQLFRLLEDPDVDNTRDYYADVVHSIALIIEGLKSRFPEKARDSYVNKLIELSRVPIDFSDQDEVEEKTSVLYKVAYGFYVLLTVYKDDKEFLGIFRIQSKQKKNVITEFLKFIGANEFYKKRILNYLKLINAFVRATESTFCGQIRNNSIYKILEYGLDSKNDKIIGLAKKTKELIHNY